MSSSREPPGPDPEEPPRRALLDPRWQIILLGDQIADIPSDLTPGEAGLVARAVPKRARELAAGRALVRRALAAMGRPSAEILADSARAPIWPPGLSGSISHTDDYCAVVLGETRWVGHVGLDVEARTGIPDDLWPHTFVDAELEFLDGLQGEARRDSATILFSAKEAFYKAQHPLTRRLLEFHDVTIRLREGAFHAHVASEIAGLPGLAFEGRFAVTTKRVWTVLCIGAWLDL